MARPKKDLEGTSIIKPLVKDPAKPHPFEDAEKNGELPILTSVGFTRVGTTNNFVSYVMKSQGDKVLSVEVSDPNLRGIAEESSKIDFVTHFIDVEFGSINQAKAI